MERLRLEFESLARPSGLPPPGEPLPCTEEPPAPPPAQLEQVASGSGLRFRLVVHVKGLAQHLSVPFVQSAHQLEAGPL